MGQKGKPKKALWKRGKRKKFLSTARNFKYQAWIPPTFPGFLAVGKGWGERTTRRGLSVQAPLCFFVLEGDFMQQSQVNKFKPRDLSYFSFNKKR